MSFWFRSRGITLSESFSILEQTKVPNSANNRQKGTKTDKDFVTPIFAIILKTSFSLKFNCTVTLVELHSYFYKIRSRPLAIDLPVRPLVCHVIRENWPGRVADHKTSHWFHRSPDIDFMRPKRRFHHHSRHNCYVNQKVQVCRYVLKRTLDRLYIMTVLKIQVLYLKWKFYLDG